MRAVHVLHNAHAELQGLGTWVEEVTHAFGCDDRDRFRIDLVLAEVVTNIIDNAFPEGGSHAIRVEVVKAEEGLRFDVSDEGLAFDPTTAEARAKPTNLAEAMPGGHGLRLMRSYVDSIAYRREGTFNRLALGFRFSPKGT